MTHSEGVLYLERDLDLLASHTKRTKLSFSGKYCALVPRHLGMYRRNKITASNLRRFTHSRNFD